MGGGKTAPSGTQPNPSAAGTVPPSPPTSAQPSQQPDKASGPAQPDKPADNGLTQQQAHQETQAEQEMVRKLEARDREVRTHEQAHVAAASQYVSGPVKYDFQRGPDGQNYAIGGHVNLDISPIPGDPEATQEKARVLLRAALAPTEPSGADQQIAARARQMMMQAQIEAAQERQTEARAGSPDPAGRAEGENSTAATGNTAADPAAQPTSAAHTDAARVQRPEAGELAQRIKAMVGPLANLAQPPGRMHAIV